MVVHFIQQLFCHKNHDYSNSASSSQSSLFSKFSREEEEEEEALSKIFSQQIDLFKKKITYYIFSDSANGC